MFKSMGYNLASVNIIEKDGKSECYGHLNFFTQHEADKFLSEQIKLTIFDKHIILN